MAELIDLEWMGALADDEATRRDLTEIARRQRLALEENRLLADDRPLLLRLAGHEIRLEWGAAFSALEIYQEIFRDRDHGRIEGFLDGIGTGTVLDLGANFGFFALRLKELYPQCRICCVEANPRVFPYLQANLEANGYDDVQALHAAVAGTEGSVELKYIPELPAISGKGIDLVERPWMRQEFIHHTYVPGITLCQLLDVCANSLKESTIELLKLDVEGMELEVLEGGREVMGHVSRVVVEYHSEALREGVAVLLSEEKFTWAGEYRSSPTSYYGELYFHRRSMT